jgi:hypothetical protein
MKSRQNTEKMMEDLMSIPMQEVMMVVGRKNVVMLIAHQPEDPEDYWLSDHVC